MDLEQVEYNRSRGYLPDRYYYQLNGKDAFSNFQEQHKKLRDQYIQREQIKELKKKLEQQILEAVIMSFDENYSYIANAMAEDLNNKLSAAFQGGKIQPENLTNSSFTLHLGNALARALALAPFKLIDEFFDDINSK